MHDTLPWSLHPSWRLTLGQRGSLLLSSGLIGIPLNWPWSTILEVRRHTRSRMVLCRSPSDSFRCAAYVWFALPTNTLPKPIYATALSKSPSVRFKRPRWNAMAFTPPPLPPTPLWCIPPALPSCRGDSPASWGALYPRECHSSYPAVELCSPPVPLPLSLGLRLPQVTGFASGPGFLTA